MRGNRAGAEQRKFPRKFQLHSTEFFNNGIIPLSAVLNNQVNGVNTCSANGAAGGDRSPELFWTGAPWGTESYVVVLYDVTAAFTHWGMYNIKGNAIGLPVNAGAAGSAYGTQILNDFRLGQRIRRPLSAGQCCAGRAPVCLHCVCIEHQSGSAQLGELSRQCRDSVSRADRGGRKKPDSGQRQPHRLLLLHSRNFRVKLKFSETFSTIQEGPRGVELAALFFVHDCKAYLD